MGKTGLKRYTFSSFVAQNIDCEYSLKLSEAVLTSIHNQGLISKEKYCIAQLT